jgi:hypothetical protein
MAADDSAAVPPLAASPPRDFSNVGGPARGAPRSPVKTSASQQAAWARRVAAAEASRAQEVTAARTAALAQACAAVQARAAVARAEEAEAEAAAAAAVAAAHACARRDATAAALRSSLALRAQVEETLRRFEAASRARRARDAPAATTPRARVAAA